MAAQPAIEFRTGVRDKRGYALRWLAVAVRRGRRVRVLAEPRELTMLSQALWTADKESFLPHLLCEPNGDSGFGMPTGSQVRTPVLLGGGHWGEEEPELLLNASLEMPADLGGYRRVIELVAIDDVDVQAGRERWAAYRRLGLAPTHRSPGADGDVSSSGDD